MAVPDNKLFGLTDVCLELGLTGNNRNLVKAFEVAVDGNFDPLYKGAKDSLYDFRNYKGVEHLHIFSLEQFREVYSNINTVAIGASARSSGLYAGAQNTEAIINQEGHLYSAAKICKDHTNGGYNDWFLSGEMGSYLFSFRNNPILNNNIIAEGGTPVVTGDRHVQSREFSATEYTARYDEGNTITPKNAARTVRPVRIETVPLENNYQIGDMVFGGIIVAKSTS